jgi:hypothetical protein
MARMAAVVLGLAAALALTACSTARPGATDAPSASIGPGVEQLAGRWTGTLFETGAHLYQGSSTIDVRVNDNGTWSGKIGAAPASGTARLQGHRLVVTGTMRPPDEAEQPVYVELRGDDTRRWGEMSALFRGRRAPALISLERAEAI